MILADAVFTNIFTDYGIMIPIPSSRPDRILAFLGAERERAGLPDAAFPGPVLDSAGALRVLGVQSRLTGDGGLVGRTDLGRVHDPSYVDKLYGDGLLDALLDAYELLDADGKPCRYEPERATRPLRCLFDAIEATAAGSYLACRLALDAKARGASPFCYFLGGGNHHARSKKGAGFCVINDMIIAARKLQAEGRSRLVWYIDVDVHKGCGSAELVRIFRTATLADGRLNPRRFEDGCEIRTLDAHMARGWPLDEETLRGVSGGEAPLIPADVDIPVEAGGEAGYAARLADGLRALEAQSGGQRPDIAIVVDGADVYEKDGLASSSLLQLSLGQCLERDRLLYAFLAERGIPQAWILAGGYGEAAWEPTGHFLASLYDAERSMERPIKHPIEQAKEAHH